MPGAVRPDIVEADVIGSDMVRAEVIRLEAGFQAHVIITQSMSFFSGMRPSSGKSRASRVGLGSS